MPGCSPEPLYSGEIMAHGEGGRCSGTVRKGEGEERTWMSVAGAGTGQDGGTHLHLIQSPVLGCEI